MSQESVNAFFSAVQSDRALATKLDRELETANGDLVVAAGKLGFEFSASDLEQAAESRGGTLSEEDLASVVGGGIEGSDIGSGASATPATAGIGRNLRKKTKQTFGTIKKMP